MSSEKAAGDEQKTDTDYMSELLGDAKLTAKDGSSVDLASLKDFEAVGFYFSAHWCPPCRGFTPVLAKFYTEMKEKNPKKFEIIFISSDRDEKAFDEYYKESHPWLRSTWAWNKDNKGRINKAVKGGNGIPSLCLVDPKTGELITSKGTQHVRGGDATKFPWKPRGFWEIVNDGPDFLTKEDGKTLSAEALRTGSDYTMLYFSAHWCPPCRGFTPKFAKWYTDNVSKMPAGKTFETVFFSSDKDQDAFNEYYAEMPWKAVPTNKDPRTQELKSKFDVNGIPSVIVINNATGKQAEPRGCGGRAGVSSDPNAEKFPWPRESPGTLADNISPINELPMCIVFAADADEATRAKCMDALRTVATPYLEKANQADKDMELNFNLEDGTAPGGMMAQIKRLFKLGDGDKLMITDLPNECYYKHPTVKDFGEITSECVTQFVQDFKDGKLTKVALE